VALAFGRGKSAVSFALISSVRELVGPCTAFVVPFRMVVPCYVDSLSREGAMPPVSL